MHSTEEEGPAGLIVRSRMEGKERGRANAQGRRVEGQLCKIQIPTPFRSIHIASSPARSIAIAGNWEWRNALEKLLRVLDATERKVGFLPRFARK